jgi:hypothetical protein
LTLKRCVFVRNQQQRNAYLDVLELLSASALEKLSSPLRCAKWSTPCGDKYNPCNTVGVQNSIPDIHRVKLHRQQQEQWSPLLRCQTCLVNGGCMFVSRACRCDGTSVTAQREIHRTTFVVLSNNVRLVESRESFAKLSPGSRKFKNAVESFSPSSYSDD